jgi:glycosyltransferase involved in cell wall biosynthesis
VKLSVLVPVFNERDTIEEILRRIRAVPLEKEIVVVDDGSTDGTREWLSALPASPDLRIVLHERNRGKGAAIRTAIGAMTGDVAIFQDADLEYDPRDYPKLLRPIEDGRADVVVGTRFSGEVRAVLFFWHARGNRAITFLFNLFANTNLEDLECGLKAFRAPLLKRLRLSSDGFEIEPELMMAVARSGCRIYEVPVSYFGRTYDEGKKITWWRGVDDPEVRTASPPLTADATADDAAIASNTGDSWSRIRSMVVPMWKGRSRSDAR